VSYVLAAVLVAALALQSPRARAWLTRARWKIAARLSATAALLGAVIAGARGGWIEALLFGAVGMLLLAPSSRGPTSKSPGPGEAMSLADARAVLGVAAGASEADIRAAYARLMRRAHPDAGGTSGLATQLNLARDRLLRG
jgi:DnaJ-domain-containing protein 1